MFVSACGNYSVVIEFGACSYVEDVQSCGLGRHSHYFVEIMFVNVLKIFWGRMRFQNMDGDYSQFTSWFMPQGVQENGVKSKVYKQRSEISPNAVFRA